MVASSAQQALDAARGAGINVDNLTEMLNGAFAYEDHAVQYYEAMEAVRVISFISIMFFLPMFQEILFAFLAKRHYQLFSVENFLRTVFMLVFMIIAARHYSVYDSPVESASGDVSK